MRVSVVALAVACSAMIFSGCGSTGSSSSSTPPALSTPDGGNSGGSSAGSGSGGSSTGSGSGSSGSANSTVAIAFAGAGPNELSGTNQFYGIAIDSSGKVSITPGSPYSAGVIGAGPLTNLAATNNLLFVTGHASSDTNAIKITSFRSDANGRLTLLSSTAASGALYLTADASGKYLYASAMADPAHQGFSSPTIYGFIVDQTSGGFAPVPGSPWNLNYGGSGGELNMIGVSPDGSHLCASIVLSRNSEAIECYPRRSDGTIDPNSFQAVTHGTLPQNFTFTSDGSHVLALNPDSNTVQASPLPGANGSNQASSGGTNPNGLALDPTGHWLAIANRSSGNVSVIEVGGQGSLAPTATNMPVGTGTYKVVFSHSGNYLFVTANEGTFVFSFNPNTGALTALNSDKPAPGTGNVASL